MTSRFRVEQGHVQAFARAVGSGVPEVGEAVPATFMTCSIQQEPDHMLGLRPAGPLAGLDEGADSVLHAEQRFEYFAPIRVGDVVLVSERPGRTWMKEGAAGQLDFQEFIKEFRDPDGHLVQRATMTLVRIGGQA